MRSDLLQLMNLAGAQLRPEHADALLRHLDPAERVTALHTVALGTATCLCFTTSRLLVVDGPQGDQVRCLPRDPAMALAAVRTLTGLRARFTGASGVLDLRGVARAHLPELQRFFSDRDRDPAGTTPTPSDAPPGAQHLAQLAIDYVDVLVDVTVRDGCAPAFMDLACGGLPLVDDHAYRFFVACDALHALALADQGGSDLARQLYDVLVEWFLAPAGSPGVMPQLAAALRPEDPALREAHQQHLDVLQELCDGLPAEDGSAVRHHRAAFLAELHHRHGLDVPAEHAGSPSAPVEGVPHQRGAAARDDLVGQLEQLAGLLSEGLLSDSEFSAAKQRLLALAS